MINIGDRTYRLCLLDTNILSEMLKNPRAAFRVFGLRFLSKGWIPAFSLFSIFEIRQRPDLFALFLDYFSDLPSVLLKGHEQLLQEELSAYPGPSQIDPVLLAPVGIRPPQGWSRRKALEHLFSSDSFVEREHYWKHGRSEILEGILSLVRNFPPHQGRYSDLMCQDFVNTNVLQQVTMRYPDALAKLNETPDKFNPRAFPSIRIMALTVFLKFYPDNRRPSKSDVFDIVITAPAPYVDGVITERHQASVLEKGKRLDVLDDDLEIYTIAALRDRDCLTG